MTNNLTFILGTSAAVRRDITRVHAHPVPCVLNLPARVNKQTIFDHSRPSSSKLVHQYNVSEHSHTIPKIGYSFSRHAINCHEKPSTSSNSRIIQGLLNEPTSVSNKSTKVVSMVNDILSCSENVSRSAATAVPNQKYVVMPVLQPAKSGANRMPSQVKYVLVNAASIPRPLPMITSKSICGPIPLLVRPRAAVALSPRVPGAGFCYPVFCRPPVCCTAVISSEVNTVRKWFSCNRDMISKTLISIATKLNVSVTVALLLSASRNKESEHVVVKWIGIALMLLTKHQVKEATGYTGGPIPSSLYHMWNHLRSFFSMYEGCLKIVRRERSLLSRTDRFLQELRTEDKAFEEIIGKVTMEYNRVTPGKNIPTPNELDKLCDFIGSLTDSACLNVDTTRNDNGITSILQQNLSYKHRPTSRQMVYGSTLNDSTKL